MNLYLKFLLAFIFVANLQLDASAQKIDTYPLDAYWELISPLKNGDSLSVDRWTQLAHACRV